MELITDLQLVKSLAEKKEQKNWKFRMFLKGLDVKPRELDKFVHEINNRVTAKIDCTKCANCCKSTNTLLDADDVTKFARGLKISTEELKEKYLTKVVDPPYEYSFKGTPCPFLKNNLCTNYKYRPKDCASFPHLHKKDFNSRTIGIINNCDICPIVFNVIEELKTVLWHRDFDPRILRL